MGRRHGVVATKHVSEARTFAIMSAALWRPLRNDASYGWRDALTSLGVKCHCFCVPKTYRLSKASQMPYPHHQSSASYLPGAREARKASAKRNIAKNRCVILCVETKLPACSSYRGGAVAYAAAVGPPSPPTGQLGSGDKPKSAGEK